MRSCLQDATLAVLVVALSIASIFLTQTLLVFTTQVQFETKVTKKEYSQPLSTRSLVSNCILLTSTFSFHIYRHVGRRLASVLSPRARAENRNGGGRERALLRWRQCQRRVAIPARVRVRRRGAARRREPDVCGVALPPNALHCLLNLHAQLSSSPPSITDDDNGDDGRGGRPRYAHLQHCLNYLRQQALCHPDLTLEPGDREAGFRRGPSGGEARVSGF